MIEWGGLSVGFEQYLLHEMVEIMILHKEALPKASETQCTEYVFEMRYVRL